MSIFGSLKTMQPSETPSIPFNPSLQHNKKLRKILSQENFIQSLQPTTEFSSHHDKSFASMRSSSKDIIDTSKLMEKAARLKSYYKSAEEVYAKKNTDDEYFPNISIQKGVFDSPL